MPQRLTTQTAIDAWFEQKTKNLNNFQKAVLRKRWATMEELMSAGERKQRIVANIIEDFSLKLRLNNDRGTAILVAASVYDACHYFRLFQNTSFGPYCGIVTSFEPNHNAISKDPKQSDERYKFDTYTQHVLNRGQTTKQYEDEVKRRFIHEPANMKLMIVVSKLLTGFDAPSCMYIYLDNELHDHNLFQAICRTNRLDGDDKDYGYIIDFKELFGDVEKAIAVYSSNELDHYCPVKSRINSIVYFLCRIETVDSGQKRGSYRHLFEYCHRKDLHQCVERCLDVQPFAPMATKTYTDTAIQICVFTAFSDVP